MKCLLKHVLIFVSLWFAAVLTVDMSAYPPEPTSWVYWLVAASLRSLDHLDIRENWFGVSRN